MHNETMLGHTKECPLFVNCVCLEFLFKSKKPIYSYWTNTKQGFYLSSVQKEDDARDTNQKLVIKCQ